MQKIYKIINLRTGRAVSRRTGGTNKSTWLRFPSQALKRMKLDPEEHVVVEFFAVPGAVYSVDSKMRKQAIKSVLGEVFKPTDKRGVML